MTPDDDIDDALGALRDLDSARAAPASEQPAAQDVAVAELEAQLTSSDRSMRRRAFQTIRASGRRDAALVAIARTILTGDAPREVAESALLVAAVLGAPALIAARARRDRTQRIADAMSALPLVERVAAARAVSTDVLAEAVVLAHDPVLAATAKLELERCHHTVDRERWARALIAADPAGGEAYLARMRGRPGWGTVVGELPPPALDPLDDLLSPLADVRRRALDALAAAPHAERLQALLLAAELDRDLMRELYKQSWRSLQATAWLPVLAAHGDMRPMDRVLGGDSQLAALRADQWIDELVASGVGRAALPVPQQLSAGLRELAARGVADYGAQLAVPPPSDQELVDLDAEEAEIASQA